MIERHLIIDGADPVVFYGAGNANLRMLKSLYPKLRIVACDNVMRVIGDEDVINEFEKFFKKLVAHCNCFNSLVERDIIDIRNGAKTAGESGEEVLLYGTNGKPVRARSENQLRLVEAFSHNDLIFANGPAGTGKTYTAIALAVRELKRKTVRRIVLSRPAVEAGEKLGFLPGDMREKIDPYLQPLYDALEEMIPTAKLKEYMEADTIQIAPLAFMRGRTLSDAVVVLDEAQNTTSSQIKMFLTRMGTNTKMIVTGDCTQIDLPNARNSGLVEALRILRGIDGIAFIELNKKDIIRHKLVTRIVEAYEKETRNRHKDENFREESTDKIGDNEQSTGED